MGFPMLILTKGQTKIQLLDGPYRNTQNSHETGTRLGRPEFHSSVRLPGGSQQIQGAKQRKCHPCSLQ